MICTCKSRNILSAAKVCTLCGSVCYAHVTCESPQDTAIQRIRYWQCDNQPVWQPTPVSPNLRTRRWVIWCIFASLLLVYCVIRSRHATISWGKSVFFQWKSVSIRILHLCIDVSQKIATLCNKNRQPAAKNQNRSFTSRGATVKLRLRL